jgi:antitoxin ParD1/3/4
VNVSLTPQLEAMIQERVASGRYTDASEVVAEAMRLLEERERLDHLRSLLAVGMEKAKRGELVELTPELMAEIAQRARERVWRGEAPDPDVCP